MNQISPAGPLSPDAPEPDLVSAIQRLAHTNMLIVGDVMLDRYVYGEVSRISVEAPVPILAIDREVEMPGGAGNVLRNLTALGAAGAFITVVGDDVAGSALTALIGGQANVEPWLLVQGGRTTTQKTRFIAKGHQLFRADREQTDPIHPRLAERMVRIAVDAMAATSVTVLSDYGKGVLAGDVPTRLLEAARSSGRMLIVDPRGVDFSRYRGADIVMPNRPELAAATGMPVDTEVAIVAAAVALRERFEFGAVVVTRGNDGMTLVDTDGVRHFPAEAADVYDTSGCGDTALAALAAGVAAKLPLAVAVRLANIAAGSRGREGRISRGARSRIVGGGVAGAQRDPQSGVAAGSSRAGRAMAASWLACRFHQWVFRSAAPWSSASAGGGTRRLRSVDRWVELGPQFAAAQRADAAGATAGRAGGGPRKPGVGRPGLCVR